MKFSGNHMVFLSNLQVTAYWITNLSLDLFSFLFHTPFITSLFFSTLKFLNIWSVKHSFIEAQYYFGLNSIEIEYELCYAHSLLAIPHHQLKDNSKFNVNFNLNMKYDYVRVKQKHLILISQHHWSPITPHPPSFCFSSSSLLWKFKKIGKKWAIICIANTWFWDSEQKLLPHTEVNRGFVLDSEQKLRYSDN